MKKREWQFWAAIALVPIAGLFGALGEASPDHVNYSGYRVADHIAAMMFVQAPPPAPQAPAADAKPKLDLYALLRIAKLQRDFAQAQANMKALEAEYAKIATQAQSLQSQISAAAQRAMADAKVDRAKWTLNMNTLELASVAGPPPAGRGGRGN